MNKPVNITIEDVARAAGVSRQTVSRVLNRKPGVKPAVRERIEGAIAELGYVPNLAARRMGGARSFLIMAINDRARTIENWSAGRGNDWVDQMLHGGMLACEEHGYHMLFELVDTGHDEAVRQVGRILTSLQPDGIILTQPHSENVKLAQLLRERGRPFARIALPNPDIPSLSVHFDDAAAARACVDHLRDFGHERIAFIAGDSTYQGSVNRREGFAAAMRDAELEPVIGECDFSFDKAASWTRDRLTNDSAPTAFIAENDEMAFAVLNTANELDLGVPEHLSLISFEDTPGARFSVPPLTAVRQPTAAMIGRACEVLIEATGKGEVEGDHVLPFELKIRSTTGPAPQ